MEIRGHEDPGIMAMGGGSGVEIEWNNNISSNTNK